jgi:hypothetical protein
MALNGHACTNKLLRTIMAHGGAKLGPTMAHHGPWGAQAWAHRGPSWLIGGPSLGTSWPMGAQAWAHHGPSWPVYACRLYAFVSQDGAVSARCL